MPRRTLQVAGWVFVPLLLIAFGGVGGFLYSRTTDSSPSASPTAASPSPTDTTLSASRACLEARIDLSGISNSFSSLQRDWAQAFSKAKTNSAKAIVTRTYAGKFAVLQVQVATISPPDALRLVHSLLSKAVAKDLDFLEKFADAWDNNSHAQSVAATNSVIEAQQLHDKASSLLGTTSCA